MISQPTQVDPIGSPHPVPWGWVMSMLSEGRSPSTPRTRYYRSRSLVSPNRQYAAYSRMQMQLSTDFTQNRVTSILFLENLKTGGLQTIAASSPFANNPFADSAFSDSAFSDGSSPDGSPESAAMDQPGTIAMLIPVAWSETGDRILAREFESIFGSGIASDFGVVWEQHSNQVHTVAPTQIHYSNSILLGWSQSYPDRALFRAGMMGEAGSLYAVDAAGHTLPVVDDRPLTFGQVVSSIWAGPQASGR
ncbi:MAG TPA: hypothetical protein V6C57_27785 [Coleofasciculaceae cyanobacterium]